MTGAVLLGALFWGGQVRVTSAVDAPKADPSTRWSKLLSRASSPEGVDYEVIERERDTLEQYIAWLGEHGPFEDEMKESHEDRRIAFLVNAYNAAVIYGVLRHRPIDSVRDVRVGPYRWGGSGFFVGQKFHIDGNWTTLRSLELQDIVNRYQEPLVHAALVCGSKSCPSIRWWTPRKLQGQLETAMKKFLASDRGLRRQGDGWAASALFSWYEDDFLYWSDATTLCEWMEPYTSGDAATWMAEHAEDCPLGALPWDWSLNDTRSQRIEGAGWPADGPESDDDEGDGASSPRDTGEGVVERKPRPLRRRAKR